MERKLIHKGGMKMSNAPLIVLKQQPIIEYSFEDVKKRLSEITELTDGLVSEGSLKEMKELRSILNKEFELLETARKNLKKGYMVNFNEFETVYKQEITQEVNAALSKLASKISEAETKILNDKIAELKTYYAEYALTVNVTEIEYERLELRVTPGADLGPLKKQIRERLDKISSELTAISTMEHSIEVKKEYLVSLDLPASIAKVNEALQLAKRAMEREAEERARLQSEARIAQFKEDHQLSQKEETPPSPVASPLTPEVVDTYVLTITTTEAKMAKLLEYLEKEEIHYE